MQITILWVLWGKRKEIIFMNELSDVVEVFTLAQLKT